MCSSCNGTSRSSIRHTSAESSNDVDAPERNAEQHERGSEQHRADDKKELQGDYQQPQDECSDATAFAASEHESQCDSTTPERAVDRRKRHFPRYRGQSPIAILRK